MCQKSAASLGPRMMPKRLSSRIVYSFLLGLSSLSLFGCTQNGHLNLLGYTTEPVYDPNIHTVYVPIFKNVSFRRGIEFTLTRAIIREIEANTPFKVVSCRENADTELDGKIINWRKSVININQLNEIREGEIGIAVELTWRDLRPGFGGDVLSGAKAREPGAPEPKPILVEPTATFIPELGGSVTSAEKMITDNLARAIIYKMEIARPW